MSMYRLGPNGPTLTNLYPMSMEKPQWTELFREVVTSGLCTGCAACVVSCPHDVLDYKTADGIYKPWHIDKDGDAENCTHGETGCTLCTRACPRFRNWESEADTLRFARERTAEEVYGIGDVFLARSSDPSLVENGQDGGFVSTLLIYALENDVIDAAGGHGIQNPLYGVAVRVQKRHAAAVADVLDDHVFHKRGLAHTGLTDDVNVTSTIFGFYAEFDPFVAGICLGEICNAILVHCY